MLKYSEIKKELAINPVDNSSKDYAYFTHYLQTKNKYYLTESVKEIFNTCDIKSDSKIKFDIPFPPTKNKNFTFIDLFAGIGGFRIAMQKAGGKCVFSSEIDIYAKQTYEVNFGEVPFGDITKINEKEIPEHDILCAGFPCQAFSIAGKREGFKDATRGTLFFDIARIIKEKKPEAFILENVKGLKSHDKGKTLKTILSVLRDELNYYVPEPELLNAKDFGVPQSRNRIFIVGFRKDLNISEFNYPEKTNKKVKFGKVKEKEEVSVKYYLSKQYLNTLKKHKERHKAKGNGFGYTIIKDSDCANAIVIGGMGKERNLLEDRRLSDFTPVTPKKGGINREYIRTMTPREWARLQGFPEKYKIEVSDGQAYKQFGNSVAIPVIKAIGKIVIDNISSSKNQKKS